MNSNYMNPYLAGFFLGLVLLATIFITGRGLGASGAIKSVVVAAVDGMAPSHAENSQFYGTYVGPGKDNPLKSWLVFEIAGVVIGAFISGLVSDRLKIVTEAGPRVGTRLRWMFAALGVRSSASAHSSPGGAQAALHSAGWRFCRPPVSSL